MEDPHSERVLVQLGLTNIHQLRGQSLPVLLSALSADLWSMRVEALRAIEYQEQSIPLQHLLPKLLDPFPYVRSAAADVLAHYKDRRLVRPLIHTTLNDPSWIVRASGVRALGKQGRYTPSTFLIAAMYDSDFSVREAAVYSLKNRRYDRSILPHLIQSLQDETWLIRLAAVEVLATRCETCINVKLKQLLNDEDEEVRDRVYHILQKRGYTPR